MNILMVCMGNICRSPLAEGIGNHIIKQQAQSNIMIDSCGTHAYHVGHSPDPRAIAVAKRHGIDISAYKARQFQASDWDRFDYIMVADSNNQRQLNALANNEQQRQTIIKMLAAHPTQPNADVPDPYYADEAAFLHTYQLLETALSRWFDAL